MTTCHRCEFPFSHEQKQKLSRNETSHVKEENSVSLSHANSHSSSSSPKLNSSSPKSNSSSPKSISQSRNPTHSSPKSTFLSQSRTCSSHKDKVRHKHSSIDLSFFLSVVVVRVCLRFLVAYSTTTTSLVTNAKVRRC
jgi:cobalamin biosynthesis Mg chelatase CobN